MSELLLHEKLLASKPKEDEVRMPAGTVTLLFTDS